MKKVQETWKRVKDFPLYEVSNLGRVRSNLHTEPRILKPSLVGNHRKKYMHVSLLGRGFLLHRLVAEAFLRKPRERCIQMVVTHIDGDPRNNRADNLKWVSASTLHMNSTTKPVVATILGRSEKTLWFPSMSEGARTTGVRQGSVSLAAKGVYAKTYGTKGKFMGRKIAWRYADKEEMK